MEREQTTIRLSADLKRELQQEADRQGIVLNAFILRILERNINHEKD